MMTEVEILLQEYSLLRAEVMDRAKETKSHIRYFQAFAVILLAILSAYVSQPSGSRLLIPWWILEVGLFVLITIADYMVFDLLESYFTISAVAALLAVLEEQINAIMGKRLLLWESEISGMLLWRAIPGAWNPGRLTAVGSAILMFIVFVVLPFVIDYILWERSELSRDWQLIFVSVVFLYSLGSFTLIVITATMTLLRFRERARSMVSNLVRS